MKFRDRLVQRVRLGRSLSCLLMLGRPTKSDTTNLTTLTFWQTPQAIFGFSHDRTRRSPLLPVSPELLVPKDSNIVWGNSDILRVQISKSMRLKGKMKGKGGCCSIGIVIVLNGIGLIGRSLLLIIPENLHRNPRQVRLWSNGVSAFPIRPGTLFMCFCLLIASIPPDVEEPLSYPMRVSPPSTTNASTWKRMIPLSPQQCRRYHFSYGDGTDETSLISSAEETLVYPEEPPSEIGDVSVWQTLPIPIDPHSLHTLAEKPPDAVQIENTPTSSTAPPEPPEDIQALLDAKTSQIPVSFIVSREAKLLPFNLSEKHGCVFLGFFDIKDTSVSCHDRMCQMFR